MPTCPFLGRAGAEAEIEMGELADSMRMRITEIVEAMVSRRGGAPVTPDQNLSNAGLTSLDLVNLMLAIEDEFAIEIPQRRMTPANFRTIAAIEAVVADLALAAA